MNPTDLIHAIENSLEDLEKRALEYAKEDVHEVEHLGTAYVKAIQRSRSSIEGIIYEYLAKIEGMEAMQTRDQRAWDALFHGIMERSGEQG